jgi:hypothetical protein
MSLAETLPRCLTAPEVVFAGPYSLRKKWTEWLVQLTSRAQTLACFWRCYVDNFADIFLHLVFDLSQWKESICMIGRPLGHISAKSQGAFCGLARSNLQSSNSPLAASSPSPQVIKLVHEKFDETPLASEGSWAGLLKTGFACLRLARLHTLMGLFKYLPTFIKYSTSLVPKRWLLLLFSAWAIFPAPAIYTVILYHSSSAAVALDASEKILACIRLSMVMLVCVLR